MVYFSLTAKFEWLTLVRPAATARAHSRSRNAFGEKTLTSCLTRVGGPEIRLGRTSVARTLSFVHFSESCDVSPNSITKLDPASMAAINQIAEHVL